MIRNLLATTAIATLVATGAFAQTPAPTTTDPAAPAPGAATPGATAAPETPMVIKAEGNLASNIIGETVYNGTGDDAENIGEVNDIIISQDGNIEAVVIGVGGFLGIGQKDVAIEYDLVKWEERDNDRYLVVETSREALEAQQEFDEAAYRPMPADAEVTETKPATAEDLASAPVQEEGAEAPADTAMAPATEAPATDEPAADDMAAAPADGDAAATDEQTAAAPTEEPATDSMAQAPADDEAATDETQTGAIDRSTLKEQPVDQITAENFVGTTVYGANDEQIGEIGDVVLAPDTQDIDAVLVDVGGFLGIGEKQVALGMDNLQFMADEDGDLYLYTNLSKEQLEAQPAYDESGYAENRDEMRMNVPAMQ
jgi:sporulation protein YlmC with PRC-barrel domain